MPKNKLRPGMILLNTHTNMHVLILSNGPSGVKALFSNQPQFNENPPDFELTENIGPDTCENRGEYIAEHHILLN